MFRICLYIEQFNRAENFASYICTEKESLTIGKITKIEDYFMEQLS